MPLWFLVLLGVTPILILAFFLVILRWTARISMFLALLSVLFISIFIWKVPGGQIAGASVDGLSTAFEILYIVFGALLLLNTLKNNGALGVIKNSIANVTEDRRIQVIIILWIFGAFLEGAAGYGSTGAVIGSMLVGLGFPAMAAGTMVMLFQSQTVSFGASGAPIWIGLNTGLGEGKIESVNSLLQVTSWNEFLTEMGFKIAIIHGIVGAIIPLFMVVLLCRFFGENKSFKEGFGAWKFAIFGGLCLSIPYVLSAAFLGPEFPSIMGGLIGIIPAIIAAKKGWFMPKDKVWRFGEKSTWEKEWVGVMDVDPAEEKIAAFSTLKAWTPYLVIAILLFITQVDFLPVSSWLENTVINVNSIFGSDIDTEIEIFTNPGFLFIIVAFLTIWFHRMKWSSFKQSLKESTKTIWAAGSALVFAVPMVQIFLYSDGGAAGLESMPQTLALGLSFASGQMWAFIAPIVGALGAFLAGSNVFSNLMFSQFQLEMAEHSNLNTLWVVALQCVGAAAGNMFSVHNVITAAAAVGLVGQEGSIIRKILIPAAYYIILTGAIGYVILIGIGFNIGTFVIAAILVILMTAILVNQGYYKREVSY